MDKIIT